jgi:hypothetical protein
MALGSDMKRWASNVRKVATNQRGVISGAAELLAETARDEIRDRLPPGGSKSVFPGYAATGHLRRSIVSEPVRYDGHRFRARVGLDRNASTLLRRIASVHERGAIIRPRRAPALVFQVQGRWVRTQQVRIRAKHYFSQGWAAASRRIPALLTRLIERGFLNRA